MKTCLVLVVGCLLSATSFAQEPIQNTILGMWAIQRDERGKPTNGTLELQPDGGFVAYSETNRHSSSGTYQINGTPLVGNITLTNAAEPDRKQVLSFQVYDNGRTLALAKTEAKDADHVMVLHRPTQSDPNRVAESKKAMAAFGLTGYWSADCTQPPSYKNIYTQYNVPSDGPATIRTIVTPNQTGPIPESVVETATLNGNMLALRTRTEPTQDYLDGWFESHIVHEGSGIRVVWAHRDVIALKKFGPYAMGQYVNVQEIEDGAFTQNHHPTLVLSRCGDMLPKPK